MKKKILHNFSLKITTLICAFIFWQLVVGIADPVVSETFRDVPVTMLNGELITDKGRVYQVVDGNTTVSVVVKGKTSVVRGISVDDLEATANFEEIELATLVPVRVAVNNIGKEQVEAVATPKNIKVNIEDSGSKKFPITAVATGVVDENYVLGGLTALTEALTVSGPESIIESITRVEAQVNVTDIKKDSVLEAQLFYYDSNNLTIDQTLLSNELSDPVEVQVEVLNTKTVPITFLTVGTPKEGYEVVDITSEPSTILVYGADEDLEKLEMFIVKDNNLDVTELSGKVEKVIDITEYLPEGIALYDVNAALVAVTVQIDKYGTRSIEVPVQSISVHNNPEKLLLEYNAVTDVMLKFNGKDDVLSNLSISDIRLTIDLSTYTTAGEYNVPVTVTTIAGCELMESIKVPIKLTKIN